eukprot:800954-Prorocentrum_minimum.AAC.1
MLPSGQGEGQGDNNTGREGRELVARALLVAGASFRVKEAKKDNKGRDALLKAVTEGRLATLCVGCWKMARKAFAAEIMAEATGPPDATLANNSIGSIMLVKGIV